MRAEPEKGLEHLDEEWLHQYHSLMEIFEELSFREKVRKVIDGLKQPKDTGEYKWAKLQILRLWAPFSAVAVPVLAVIILMSLAVIKPPSRVVEVTIIEPEVVDDLEELEVIEEEPLEPPEVEMEIPDEAVVDFDNPIPTPATDFSPQPTDFDSVAIVKSPVILRGILGSRTPGARGNALARHGGSGATEGAVLRALRWLKKNQNSDGSWDKVKPAMTALALLTFLAHGETPASEEFGPTVERAIRWLCDNQEANGRFKGRDNHDYSHPIASYALSEAFALTKVPAVKYAAEKAVKIVVNGQNGSGGWDYNCKPSARDDTSYMGWCAQALKAAKLAGLEVEGLDNAMVKAINGFRKNYRESSGYGTFGYTSPANSGLTGVGVLCMQLLGASKSREVQNGLTALERTTFNWEGGGTYNQNYYWYYITQARFHAGGNSWDAWNRLFSPVLVNKQTIIPKAIEDANGKLVDIGFWEMDPKISGHTDGVVMNTALCALQLQVYYRYLPTYRAPKEIEQEVIIEDKEADIEVKFL